MSGSFQLSRLHRLWCVIPADDCYVARLGGVSGDHGGDEAATEVRCPADAQIDRVGLPACPPAAAEKPLGRGSLATTLGDIGLPT